MSQIPWKLQRLTYVHLDLVTFNIILHADRVKNCFFIVGEFLPQGNSTDDEETIALEEDVEDHDG